MTTYTPEKPCRGPSSMQLARCHFPVVSLDVLLDVLEGMLDHGLPDTVDEEYLADVAPEKRREVLHAMRLMGLIEEDGETTAMLSYFIEGNARGCFGHLLGNFHDYRYKGLTRLATSHASQSDLEAWFATEHGVEAEMLKKAVGFYIDVCLRVGKPLSPYYQVPPLPMAQPA